jgi:hypothetical protein
MFQMMLLSLIDLKVSGACFFETKMNTYETIIHGVLRRKNRALIFTAMESTNISLDVNLADEHEYLTSHTLFSTTQRPASCPMDTGSPFFWGNAAGA